MTSGAKHTTREGGNDLGLGELVVFPWVFCWVQEMLAPPWN